MITAFIILGIIAYFTINVLIALACVVSTVDHYPHAKVWPTLLWTIPIGLPALILIALALAVWLVFLRFFPKPIPKDVIETILIVANQPSANGYVYTEESLKTMAKYNPDMRYDHDKKALMGSENADWEKPKK